MGNKSCRFLKQKPLCNGYCIISEPNDVLKCGFCESLLGYDNID